MTRPEFDHDAARNGRIEYALSIGLVLVLMYPVMLLIVRPDSTSLLAPHVSGMQGVLLFLAFIALAFVPTRRRIRDAGLGMLWQVACCVPVLNVLAMLLVGIAPSAVKAAAPAAEPRNNVAAAQAATPAPVERHSAVEKAAA